MIKEAGKLMSISKNSREGLRVAAAFIAGMAIAAILAQTPAAGSLLSPLSVDAPGAPALPAAPNYLETGDRPDTGKPAEPYTGELVYATINDPVPPCCKGYPGRQPATLPA